nr:hypothetical protein 36 [Burkholderiaceae bacterium]
MRNQKCGPVCGLVAVRLKNGVEPNRKVCGAVRCIYVYTGPPHLQHPKNQLNRKDSGICI